jgi:signal transduction histidine kinase
MTLKTRLLLFGALLPSVILAATVAFIGVLFERTLIEGVDEAMRTQAAVESVSLFDGPTASTGVPHVHLNRSLLATQVVDVASSIAIYDAGGVRVAQYPDDYDGYPTTLRASGLQRTRPHDAIDTQGRAIRVHVLGVASPTGATYTLWLGHDLRHHQRTLHAYYQSGVIVTLLVALVLFLLQWAHATRIHRRIQNLVAHMQRLRAGDFSSVIARDDAHDEIATLRRAILDATRELHAAKRTQERLVSEAAHELRTPLATMRAAVDVTLRRERSTDELREALKHVREEVDRLTELSGALLDLAALRGREQERVDFDVFEIISKSVYGASGAAESNHVRVELGEMSRCSITGSPREVRQALDNLLANAVAYAPPESLVRVSVSSTRERVRVTVENDGEGIPESQRELIFEPFHRGPRSHEGGQGLGLAIVRDIALRHGGNAFVVPSTRGVQIAFELALS